MPLNIAVTKLCMKDTTGSIFDIWMITIVIEHSGVGLGIEQVRRMHDNQKSTAAGRQ